MLPLWQVSLGWLLTVVIVTGNGLVVYLITTRRNLRTTTNWFVLSLAVADFGVGTLYFPLSTLCWTYQSCDYGEVIAVHVAIYIGYFLVYASVTNLCALTLDRYLAIVKPLRYVTFMTKKRVALLILTAWGVASLIFISLIVRFFAVSGKTQEVMDESIWLCVTVLCFVVCVFLLSAAARIFLIVRRIAKQNNALTAQLNFNHRIQRKVAFKARETASAKMVGIVVTIFIICYSLDIVDNVYIYIGFSRNKTLILLLRLLRLMNSAANPVAYAFHKTEINRELRRLFRRSNREKVHNNFVMRGKQMEQYELQLHKHRVDQQPGS